MRTLNRCVLLAALMAPVAARAQFYPPPYQAPALPQMPGPTMMNSMPLAGGMTSYNGMVDGQSMSGTTMPLAGGMTTSTFTNGMGRSTTCTSMPLAGGMTSTNCY